MEFVVGARVVFSIALSCHFFCDGVVDMAGVLIGVDVCDVALDVSTVAISVRTSLDSFSSLHLETEGTQCP